MIYAKNVFNFGFQAGLLQAMHARMKLDVLLVAMCYWLRLSAGE